MEEGCCQATHPKIGAKTEGNVRTLPQKTESMQQQFWTPRRERKKKQESNNKPFLIRGSLDQN